MAGWYETSWKKNHLFRVFTKLDYSTPTSTSDINLYCRYYSDLDTVVQGNTESASTQLISFGLDASDVPLVTGTTYAKTDSILRTNTNAITFANEYSPANPALSTYNGLNIYYSPNGQSFVYIMKLRFQIYPTSVGTQLDIPVGSVRIQID